MARLEGIRTTTRILNASHTLSRAAVGFAQVCEETGTVLKEYAHNVPKPMVKIGSRTVLWDPLRPDKCTGLWQCTHIFMDKQSLQELKRGVTLWKVWRQTPSKVLDAPERIPAGA